jgi:hypothetical protein
LLRLNFPTQQQQAHGIHGGGRFIRARQSLLLLLLLLLLLMLLLLLLLLRSC